MSFELFSQHFTACDVREHLSDFPVSIVSAVIGAVDIAVPYREEEAGKSILYHHWDGSEVLPMYLPYQGTADEGQKWAKWQEAVAHAANEADRMVKFGVELTPQNLIEELEFKVQKLRG